MDDKDRTNYERDLAIAILTLWLLYETVRSVRLIDFFEFGALFNEHVRPILSRVYGTARNTLANNFGVNYQSRPDGSGGQVISLPNLQSAMDRFQRTIWDSFNNRWESKQATVRADRPTIPTVTPPQQTPVSPTAPVNRQSVPELEEPEPLYTEADAERTAVTSITEAISLGEIDAARDVEVRNGVRLVPIWRTEPDACKICAPLEGTTRRVWGARFPNGPSAHPRCRCGLEWRPLI